MFFVDTRRVGIKSAAPTLLALLLGLHSTQAQQPPASGTLTLVLANRNGFVIASDSRRSSIIRGRFKCGDTLAFFCDDSQKIFKTGPKSALAISGFASWVGGTPLDLQVASVLRRRYRYADNPSSERTGWTPPEGAHPALTVSYFSFSAYKNPDPGRSSVDEDFELEQALTAVAALAPATLAPASLNLQTLIGDFDKRGPPRIRRIDYVNNAHRAGPLNTELPDYSPVDVTAERCRTVAESNRRAGAVPFSYCFAGVDGTAERIIRGNYPSRDPAIRRYYRRLRRKTLRKMRLSEMKELVHGILVETNREALTNVSDGALRQTISVVGGGDQIGVFPTKGPSRCCGQDHLLKDEQLLPLKFIRAGFLYDGSSEPIPVNPVGISYYWGGQHDPDERIGQVFMGDDFQNVTVRLDGNYFLKNRFYFVTFRYSGGECFLPMLPSNEVHHCRIAMPRGTILPESCMIVSSCDEAPEADAQNDGAEVVGAPIQIKSTGCRRMNTDGTITFYVGGECGNTAGVVGPAIN